MSASIEWRFVRDRTGLQLHEEFRADGVDLRKMMTIRDVARWMGVSEGMIRSIDKSWLTRRFGKPRLRDLEVLAIDEIYVGKKMYWSDGTQSLACGEMLRNGGRIFGELF